jgi:hypothetical protein
MMLPPKKLTMQAIAIRQHLSVEFFHSLRRPKGGWRAATNSLGTTAVAGFVFRLATNHPIYHAAVRPWLSFGSLGRVRYAQDHHRP